VDRYLHRDFHEKEIEHVWQRTRRFCPAPKTPIRNTIFEATVSAAL
jgi:hypothetical protein